MTNCPFLSLNMLFISLFIFDPCPPEYKCMPLVITLPLHVLISYPYNEVWADGRYLCEGLSTFMWWFAFMCMNSLVSCRLLIGCFQGLRRCQCILPLLLSIWPVFHITKVVKTWLVFNYQSTNGPRIETKSSADNTTCSSCEYSAFMCLWRLRSGRRLFKQLILADTLWTNISTGYISPTNLR